MAYVIVYSDAPRFHYAGGNGRRVRVSKKKCMCMREDGRPGPWQEENGSMIGGPLPWTMPD